MVNSVQFVTDNPDDYNDFLKFRVYDIVTEDGVVTYTPTVTLDDNSSYFFKATINAMESDGSDRNNYLLVGTFYRDGGGATQEGSTVSLFTNESEVLCVADFNTNANTVRFGVTGVAAETWNWKVSLEWFKVV